MQSLVVLLLMAVGVVALAAAVMYHAANAEELWPVFARRRTAAPTIDPTHGEELGDYVRRGLDDLAAMLERAARHPPQ